MLRQVTSTKKTFIWCLFNPISLALPSLCHHFPPEVGKRDSVFETVFWKQR